MDQRQALGPFDAKRPSQQSFSGHYRPSRAVGWGKMRLIAHTEMYGQATPHLRMYGLSIFDSIFIIWAGLNKFTSYTSGRRQS